MALKSVYLRQDAATARLPILMLTAKAEEVVAHRPEVGADDYVVKPFSPRTGGSGESRCAVAGAP